MKGAKFFGIGFLFLVLVFALGACSRESAPKVEGPEGVQMMLDKYPLFEKGAMTDEQIKDLGLVRRKISTQVVVFNYYRGLGKNGGWQLETLPVGAEVAADNNGRPWYKTDCTNRLYASAETAAGSIGAGRRPPGSLGFPWQLLLLPLAAVLIWYLLKKLSTADTHTTGYVGGHTTIIPPKFDKSEPGFSTSSEAHKEKDRPPIDPVDSSLGSSDNAGPIVPPIITAGRIDSAFADIDTAMKNISDIRQKTLNQMANVISEIERLKNEATNAAATQPAPQMAEEATTATPTVGTAIGILAVHGFKTVSGIETLPNGDISFNATVKKGG